MSELKNIILCADDFGLSTSISSGILKLASEQRLSAVSCMANGSAFQGLANQLSLLKGQVQIGLHLNLTEGVFLSAPEKSVFSLNELLVRTHLGLVNRTVIKKECQAQLDCFVQTMGFMPDFIDGHQHIHQFPCIRDELFALYEEHLSKHGTYIRATYPIVKLAKFQFKTAVLTAVGARALTKQLIKRGIPHNLGFAGIYDFNPATEYRALFRQWLAHSSNHTLIMCHPGAMEPLSQSPVDLISDARINELNYFLSAEFISDCQEYQVNLSTSPKF